MDALVAAWEWRPHRLMGVAAPLQALALALQAGALLFLGARYLALLRRSADYEQERARTEKMRQGERRGRVAAEKELRRVMDEKLDTSNGFFVQPIGHVTSCFKACLGTPRQGALAPSTRARIVFQRNVSPDALVGLEDFSHVWIVFVFHLNTNGKNARAHKGLRSDSHRHTYAAKIAPPMLKERVGVFSTRSPHRPNPIGITLATIASIDKKARTVFLTGVDLVDGTPVLDIKPYLPAYDSIPDARVATWVSTPQPHVHIAWKEKDAALTVVETLAPRSMHFYESTASFISAIEEILRVDVRSRHQTQRMTSSDRINQLTLDNATIKYVFTGVGESGLKGNPDELYITITSISQIDEVGST